MDYFKKFNDIISNKDLNFHVFEMEKLKFLQNFDRDDIRSNLYAHVLMAEMKNANGNLMIKKLANRRYIYSLWHAARLGVLRVPSFINDVEKTVDIYCQFCGKLFDIYHLFTDCRSSLKFKNFINISNDESKENLMYHVCGFLSNSDNMVSVGKAVCKWNKEIVVRQVTMNSTKRHRRLGMSK